ncbi:single-stranded DNA-binding protein [Serratia symbiotica]|uniref:single-stranded DNA-binding protein n=1 Tax=Serratia symbiotica TaxID=138074 RepID=UPI0030D0CFD1
MAFGKQAKALARYGKGELNSVSGTMQINQWTAKDGSTSSGYQVVADSIISALTVRPAGRNGRLGKPVMRHSEPESSPCPRPVTGMFTKKPDDVDRTPPYDEPF